MSSTTTRVRARGCYYSGLSCHHLKHDINTSIDQHVQLLLTGDLVYQRSVNLTRLRLWSIVLRLQSHSSTSST